MERLHAGRLKDNWAMAGTEIRSSVLTLLSAVIRPDQHSEWQPAVQILLYSLIFLLSVLGNALVIAVLIRNKRMRTVTNIFLLSLAVSDLMLCLFCMPFNLIPNLLKDFIFGSAVCKTTTYFMGTSVSVSTFNLVAISLERYGAICKPLQSRVWQTKSHALKVIAATWCLSFTLMTPYPIYSDLVPFTKNNNQTANMCRFLLPNEVMQQSWHTFLLLILFLIPGIVMMVAYGLISLELYQGIKFDANQKKSARAVQRQGCPVLQRKFGLAALVEGGGAAALCPHRPFERLVLSLARAERRSSTASSSGRYEDSDGCYLQTSRRPRKVVLQQLSSSSSRLQRVRSSSSAANLMAKKRVIRMLMVIVVLFFLCWMPIFSANAWRAYDTASAERRLSGTPISFILLLSYTSSCVNPIIYCFMNKRFRLGFMATFPCCPNPGPPGARGEAGEEEEGRTTGASLSRRSSVDPEGWAWLPGEERRVWGGGHRKLCPCFHTTPFSPEVESTV
ncbi:Cholecystokinin receptor type A [Galemys pyrenaicus]|uniref:Gastrin/cholecystokinin type B receptor n=1 Tax=Galemys pyrenaicus TaxID=202257 RepID=A0A8J6DM32_GALPY|nr:Cholecystokinin receptor type A [Galemys pyrenaicus]